MIYTARQLEEIQRTVGQIVLPYRAKLTPLAKDWLREKKIAVGYSEAQPEAAAGTPANAAEPEVISQPSKSGALPMLWWCDGPAGVAKAALSGAAKETSLAALSAAADARQVAAAVTQLVKDIKAGRAAGGLMLVQNSAMSLVFANRCASLRAIPGTTMPALEESMKALAPNVLVIEHPRLTLQQMKSLILRFARSRSEMSEAVQRDLKEMAGCA